MPAIWLFENWRFSDAWIPFDRENQKKLEFIHQHHDELLKHLSQTATSGKTLDTNLATLFTDIDNEEQDASVQLHFADNCISIVVCDSHFDQDIVLYPHMLLGCLSDRDVLIARMESPHIV